MTWPTEPMLRILLAENLAKLEFRVQGGFSIHSLTDEPLLEQEATDRRWMARPLHTQAARFNHAVIVAAFSDQRQAHALVEELAALGYEARVVELGTPRQAHALKPHGKSRFRVISGSFQDLASAADLMIHFQNAWRPRLVRERVEAPTGSVEFTDAGFHHNHETNLGFRVRTEPGGSVTLLRLPCERWPDSPVEDRTFAGELEFCVDNQGQLAVINVISVDTYLQGVLPAELPRDFPFEAQRALAIAARSTVLAMRDMKHVNEDWDFCAAGHCQHYSGLTNRQDCCSKAVTQSAGDVLLWKDQICDAVFHTCCGGHGEHKENVWSTPAESVLAGRPDNRTHRGPKPPLTGENAARSWILDPPANCLCHVGHEASPVLQECSHKSFRWKEVFTRLELEAIIQRKTGVDLGQLYEIQPVRRGVSGRIIELELIGSRRNLRLMKELKIREALSPDRLLSSCFSVHVESDEQGLPRRFLLHGAGHGHGCGLCQVGAGALAEAGCSAAEILQHYYPHTELRRIYPPASRTS